jgi:hypothetical protein
MSFVSKAPYEFLSEEDIETGRLSDQELSAYWEFWFRLAQTTNEADKYIISHGVFREVPISARSSKPQS